MNYVNIGWLTYHVPVPNYVQKVGRCAREERAYNSGRNDHHYLYVVDDVNERGSLDIAMYDFMLTA